MAREEAWRCDLCGESVLKEDLGRLRVGKPDWRPEDFHPVDVCRDCSGRRITEVMAVAADMDDGMVH